MLADEGRMDENTEATAVLLAVFLPWLLVEMFEGKVNYIIDALLNIRPAISWSLHSPFHGSISWFLWSCRFE